MAKTKMALIFGGRSAEHEVSVQSARNVYNALDQKKFEIQLLAIDKKASWYLVEPDILTAHTDPSTAPDFSSLGEAICLLPQNAQCQVLSLTKNKVLSDLDVAFPLVHGPYGEDGSLQGFLKTCNLAFVGADVMASANCMDKASMKKILREAQIPTAKSVVLMQYQNARSFDRLVENLGSPLFVKPANMGSSVGVSKVHNAEAYSQAIETAFKYDQKLIIEECIKGREIEVSVLGNEKIRVSLPGEVNASHDFYSYEAKYLDEKGAELHAPARLRSDQIEEIQNMAEKTYRSMDLEGMARIDLFLTEDDKILVNEINTLPGFTRISMYPKLWECSDLSYTELLSELIRLAQERFEKLQGLSTDYT